METSIRVTSRGLILAVDSELGSDFTRLHLRSWYCRFGRLLFHSGRLIPYSSRYLEQILILQHHQPIVSRIDELEISLRYNFELSQRSSIIFLLAQLCLFLHTRPHLFPSENSLLNFLHVLSLSSDLPLVVELQQSDGVSYHSSLDLEIEW